MPTDVQASLRKLASISQNLNAVSDKLTEELTSVESALKKLKLGVTAWVNLFTEELAGGEECVTSLGYCKHSGKWGLFIFECIAGCEPDGQITPLREASRDLRVKAAEEIENLIERLAEEASETTAKIAKRTDELKKIAKALSDGRS